jgi:hypothetical protein
MCSRCLAQLVVGATCSFSLLVFVRFTASLFAMDTTLHARPRCDDAMAVLLCSWEPPQHVPCPWTASNPLNSAIAARRRWTTQRTPTAFAAPTAFAGQPQPSRAPSGPRRIATGPSRIATGHRGHWVMPHNPRHSPSVWHTLEPKKKLGLQQAAPQWPKGTGLEHGSPSKKPGTAVDQTGSS